MVMKLAPGRARPVELEAFVVGRLFGALGDSWALDFEWSEEPRGAVETLWCFRSMRRRRRLYTESRSVLAYSSK